MLTRSTESFKVLTECPLIVMLLFQLYPRYIQTTIPSLIPMMVQTLALRPPRAGSRMRLACADFMAAQVKTLSFLLLFFNGCCWTRNMIVSVRVSRQSTTRLSGQCRSLQLGDCGADHRVAVMARTC